jgi:hypothetical protein
MHRISFEGNAYISGEKAYRAHLEKVGERQEIFNGK